MESTDHWKRDHLLACVMRGKRWLARFRDLLPNALMRPCLVEVGYIFIQHALELLLLKDQQVVQALLPDAPQIAFADRIGSWGMIRRFQDLDAACFRHTSKARAKFAV